MRRAFAGTPSLSLSQGYSSTGRASVSKTEGWGSIPSALPLISGRVHLHGRQTQDLRWRCCWWQAGLGFSCCSEQASWLRVLSVSRV